jgi:hypothetical protein
MSVGLHGKLSSHWTDFHEIWYLGIFLKTCRENSSLINLGNKNNGYLTRRPIYTVDHISLICSLNEKYSDKCFKETRNTHFMFNSIFYPSPGNCGAYGIMWKNVVDPGRPHTVIWRTRIACWMSKAANAHTGYVIFIAFPLQQWLHERALMLRYTRMYVACCFSRYMLDFTLKWIWEEESHSAVMLPYTDE